MPEPDLVSDLGGLPVAEFYAQLVERTSALLQGETDYVANTANVAALVYHALKARTDARAAANWVGFYFRRSEDELVLGPFQGKIACVRIRMGRGVCGGAAAQRKTMLVPNVHEFPGHIACDSASNSEVVVPLITGQGVVGVFDLDNALVGAWNEEDVKGLEAVTRVVVEASDWPTWQ